MPISIVHGSLLDQRTDAIVNFTTHNLSVGSACSPFHEAGAKLLEECKRLSPCTAGEAQITSAFALPAKYVIHASVPFQRGDQPCRANLLVRCYKNIFRLAKESDCQTLTVRSLPGIFGFHYKMAVEIALTVARQTMTETMTVIFTPRGHHNIEAYESLLGMDPARISGSH